MRQLKPASPGNEPQGNAFALLVGIAAYQSIRPLSKTVTDARDLHDVLLQNGFPASNMALLSDSEATKAAISGKLEWLARHAQSSDTVVIFFSGHGAQYIGGFWPGEYLCPVEAALDKVKGALITTILLCRIEGHSRRPASCFPRRLPCRWYRRNKERIPR